MWELTLACNLKCQHCGSRAGRPRAKELSLEERLDVVRQLAQLGAREVSLIGGEAFLTKDWLTIIRAIADHGMDCSLQTGAYHLSKEMMKRAKDAGLSALGVSLDGMENLHDRLRGVRGSFMHARRALHEARTLDLVTSVNTQITADSVSELRELMSTIIEAGARYWQVQLTVPMGNAADHPELILQPYALMTLMPLLASLHQEALGKGLRLTAGNNIGYFGPFEHLWRKSYFGCAAGENVIGLEADGSVKGCPSLPKERYGAGNVRDAPLSELWNRNLETIRQGSPKIARLWGFCRSCRYGKSCGGGCSWTADALFGRPGNNPFCHHRVISLATQGVRERLVKVEEATPAPFGTGRFELMLEKIPAPTF